jgi:hypothetical protein
MQFRVKRRAISVVVIIVFTLQRARDNVAFRRLRALFLARKAKWKNRLLALGADLGRRVVKWNCNVSVIRLPNFKPPWLFILHLDITQRLQLIKNI